MHFLKACEEQNPNEVYLVLADSFGSRTCCGRQPDGNIGVCEKAAHRPG